MKDVYLINGSVVTIHKIGKVKKNNFFNITAEVLFKNQVINKLNSFEIEKIATPLQSIEKHFNKLYNTSFSKQT